MYAASGILCNSLLSKKPFGSVTSIVEYLGRYTHKVAITKHRIHSITDHSVIIKYKDDAAGSKQKTMPLSIEEFLCRFKLHFLPRGNVKTRHYGYLQNQGKTDRLNAVRKEMNLQPLAPKINVPVAVSMPEQYGHDITQCPKCKTWKLQLIDPKEVAVVLPLPAAINDPVMAQNKASP